MPDKQLPGKRRMTHCASFPHLFITKTVNMSICDTFALSPLHFLSDFELHNLFLSQSLYDLEQQLERHQVELYFIFNRLTETGLMEPQLEPSTVTFQQQKTRRYRYHPYIERWHCGHSPIRSLPSLLTNEKLGTKGIRCRGCSEEGDFIVDCTMECRLDEEEMGYGHRSRCIASIAISVDEGALDVD